MVNTIEKTQNTMKRFFVMKEVKVSLNLAVGVMLKNTKKIKEYPYAYPFIFLVLYFS